MPRFLFQTSIATAVVALGLCSCSDDSSTNPAMKPPPALEGAWCYPKAGGSDANLFRFTVELSSDSVVYRSYLDGKRLDNVAGVWTLKADTVIASFSDSIDLGLLASAPDPGNGVSTVGGTPIAKIRTLKFLRSGAELRDPLHNIELGKEQAPP